MNALHEFTRAWASLIWDISWQVALLFVLIGLVALLAPRTSSAFRYGLWMIVLIRLCIPYSFTLPTGMSQHIQAPVEQAALTLVPAFTFPIESNSIANAPSTNSVVESHPEASNEFQWNIPAATLLFMAWLCGVLLLGGWVAFKASRARTTLSKAPPVQDSHLIECLDRLRRELGIRQTVSLHQIDDEATCSSPMVYGLFHPAIYMPPSLLHPEAKDKIEPILLHELAHIRRRDPLINALQIAVQIVFFFHPLVWWLNHILRHLREEICDDIAVSHLCGEVTQYSRCMVNVLEQSQWQAAPRWGTMGLLENNGIQLRIRRLLDGRYRVYAGMRWWAVVGVVGIGIIAASITAKQTTVSTAELKSNETKTNEAVKFSATNFSFDPYTLCIDENGNVVAGAETYGLLYLTKRTQDTSLETTQLMGPILSATDGSVDFAGIPSSPGLSIGMQYYSRIPNKLVGAQTSSNRVRLIPSKTITGKITVPQGFEPQNVTVRLLGFIVDNKDPKNRIGLHTHNYRSRTIDWSGLFEYKSNEQGDMTIPDIPTRGNFYLLAEHEGLCQTQFYTFDATKTDTFSIEMFREGIIEGMVTYEDGRPAANQKVKAYLSAPYDSSFRQGVTLPFLGMTDQDGKYKIGGLIGGEYSIHVEQDEVIFVQEDNRLPNYVSTVRRGVAVTFGNPTRDVNLKLEKGALVSGRVTASESPIAIPEAHLSALHPPEEHNIATAYARTNQDGYYKMRLPVGLTKLYFSYLPGRSFPEQQIILEIKPGETVKTVDFKVQ